MRKCFRMLATGMFALGCILVPSLAFSQSVPDAGAAKTIPILVHQYSRVLTPAAKCDPRVFDKEFESDSDEDFSEAMGYYGDLPEECNLDTPVIHAKDFHAHNLKAGDVFTPQGLKATYQVIDGKELEAYDLRSEGYHQYAALVGKVVRVKLLSKEDIDRIHVINPKVKWTADIEYAHECEMIFYGSTPADKCTPYKYKNLSFYKYFNEKKNSKCKIDTPFISAAEARAFQLHSGDVFTPYGSSTSYQVVNGREELAFMWTKCKDDRTKKTIYAAGTEFNPADVHPEGQECDNDCYGYSEESGENKIVRVKALPKKKSKKK